MELVERDGLLAELHGLLDEARAGSGRFVFVGGEAGVGKTSLVRAFCAGLPADVVALRGACDPLSTPRPLGPFHDMALTRESIARVLELPDRHERMAGMLGELSLLTVMVVDDAHWADDATLDVLRFVGRRIAGTRALVLVTYRDDEVGSGHPLRTVLGQLATADGASRIEVRPLGPDAVRYLAGDVDAEALFRLTGGNPFYVTEALASGADRLPATVTDAVLARASMLSAPAREALDVVALAPSGLEPAAVEAILPDAASSLDECIERGMLVGTAGRLSFRHELARLAVEQGVAEARRRETHERLLTSLEELPGVDVARLAHHAAAADAGDAVLRHAPAAAREASERGAAREAADHLEQALSRASSLPAAEQADLLAALAAERGRFADPVSVAALREREIALRAEIGDVQGEALALTVLAGLWFVAGRIDDARETCTRAAEVLERLGGEMNVARAHSLRAHVAFLSYDPVDARCWGLRAIAAAERCSAQAALMSALRTVGTIELLGGERDAGLGRLERMRLLASGPGGFDTIDVLTVMGHTLAEARLYGEAAPYLAELVSLAEAHDRDLDVGLAEALLAQTHLERGDWDEAISLCNRVLVRDAQHAAARTRALLTIAAVRLRRGEPDADEAVEHAAESALAAGLPHLPWRARALQAELAWQHGRDAAIAPIVNGELERVRQGRHRWAAGALAFWAWRAGEPPATLDSLAEPWALRVAGEWRAAAAAWQELGCPYERADALADGDEPALREALEIFTRLGAEPAADRVRARLRELGVKHVPMRPRAATRETPGGLTRRQLEVLTLLGDGRSNADIARELFISEKTAEHHVSAVLRKLGAKTRTEAVARARKIGVGAPGT